MNGKRGHPVKKSGQLGMFDFGSVRVAVMVVEEGLLSAVPRLVV